MRKFPWLIFGLAALSLAFSVQSASAQKIDVSVLYRQDSDSRYVAIIPGYTGPEADITGACMLDPDPANCPRVDSTMTNGSPNYMLVGTTLSLLLPDGRIALVNCQNRFSSKGNYINRRSCGMPMVQRVQAEFIGQNAKLEWPVGSDGRKTESETYKVVALLEKRTDTARLTTGEAPGSH
ncbi:MAG TPA: hypothetical protein VGI45_02120 [Terracidiphilus sp.]|jgi:hypothetical protein